MNDEDEEPGAFLRVSGGTLEERIALIAAHGRITRWKYIASAIGVTGFWAFLSTCVYVQCGG